MVDFFFLKVAAMLISSTLLLAQLGPVPPSLARTAATSFCYLTCMEKKKKNTTGVGFFTLVEHQSTKPLVLLKMLSEALFRAPMSSILKHSNCRHHHQFNRRGGGGRRARLCSNCTLLQSSSIMRKKIRRQKRKKNYY